MQQAIQIINEHFDTNILTKSRAQKFSRPRKIYFYLMKRYTNYSAQKLADSCGLKTHATVLYSIRNIENEMLLYPDVFEDVKSVGVKIRTLFDDLKNETEETKRKDVSNFLIKHGFDNETVNLSYSELITLIVKYKSEYF